MKQNLFVRGQGRGYSGLTKMMTIVALLLCMSMGAWADETYPIVYDFEAAANAGETFGNKNGSGGTGQGFYGWESAAKTDWPRQDYKGYTWGDGQTSTNLPQVCHVWRRSDRMDASSGNISNGGLKCPSDKQMAVDGLTEGLTVTIIYDATNASSKEIVWAIGDGSSSLLTQPRATATINGVEAVPGQTTIKSGDVITVNSVTEAQNGSGYIVFKVMKDMVIKKIIIDEAKAAPAGYTVSMKSGVKDADKWTVKVGEGQAQALPIGGLKGDGTETVTLQYNGRLKVKGVKATSDAAPAVKPAATVTTAPTGAAVVGVGKTTALVSGGVADGGTLWYAVTTTNTKPTSTAGFSDAVPTAKDITASGTVYVWYYVKGDDTHSDSEIAATAIEVPVADIIWDVTNISDLEVWGTDSPYTKEGVTLSGNSDDVQALYHNDGDPETDGIWFEAFGSGGFTFTAPAGKKFTKIEMKAINIAGWLDAHLLEQLGTGWTFNNPIVTWKGTAAASTVGLLTDADMFSGEPIIYIVFYLSE